MRHFIESNYINIFESKFPYNEIPASSINDFINSDLFKETFIESITIDHFAEELLKEYPLDLDSFKKDVEKTR